MPWLQNASGGLPAKTARTETAGGLASKARKSRFGENPQSAHCTALSVASGDKKYIDGACVLADNDGDKIFSTFDARDLDKPQPEMGCGTHIITGGTGKYVGITGSEPFACIAMPALAGPGGYTAMDIPHNTTWEIK
jgi:hypothetical protein